MVFGIIGENCSGKSTLAERIKETLGGEIITGKDYLRMAKSESEAASLFRKKLHSAVSGDNIIYVIADPEHVKLLPDGTIRILVTADLGTIKERFTARMHGNLPAPVALMLERKHGLFDSGEYDYRFDGVAGDAKAFCEVLNAAVMSKKALVVIDIQNDITKHYRDIIDTINAAIDWAVDLGMTVIYIKHNNLSPGTRTFKPDSRGAELAPELKVVSNHIFVKTKANALTSEKFLEFIRSKDIREFYITGADATGCVKSTCFNMTKAGYTVHVISDCVTSYDLRKIPEMLAYYTDKGCEVKKLAIYIGE